MSSFVTAAIVLTSLASCDWSGIFGSRTPSGPRTARVLWLVPGHGGGRPAYDGTTAFFLSGTDSVIAIDAQTGTIKWRSGMSVNATSTPIFGSAVCTVTASLVACGDTEVVAFHRNSGSLAWRYHASAGYKAGFYESAAVDSTFYTGSPSGTMYALDVNTGAERWVVSIGVPNVFTSIFRPVVDTGIVAGVFKRFVKPSTGGVVAVDPKTGTIRWQADFPRPSPDSATGGVDVAMWRNLVLASCNDGRIYAFDRINGAIVWSLPGVRTTPLSSPPGAAWGDDVRALTVVGDVLYATSGSGWFIAYDLTKPAELWRTYARWPGNSNLGSANTQPIVGDANSVYVIQAGGQPITFSTKDGAVTWGIVDGTTTMYGTMTLASDRVFVSGQAGFYALAK